MTMDKDEDLELALSDAYATLSSEAQARFRALGALLYAQPFDLKLLAYLWEVLPEAVSDEAEEISAGQVREWADHLCSLSLLERASETESGSGWYRQPLLAHDYALALLEAEPAEYTEMLNRYYDGTIELAYQFKKLPLATWETLDPYLPHIFATGEYLVKTYSHWTDPDLHRLQLERAQDFALNIRTYLSSANSSEVPHLAWLEMGLTVAGQLQEARWEALFSHEIGLFYDEQGKKETALQYYLKAIHLYQTIRDRSGEAASLNQVGAIYAWSGKREKALEYYVEALLLYRAVGDQKAEVTTLDYIGGVYVELDAEKALEYYAEALRLYRELGNQRREAAVISKIGGIYLALRGWEKGLEYREKALLLYRTIGDQNGEANTLNKIGQSYRAWGRQEKALQYFEEAVVLYRAAGNQAGEATTSQDISILYRNWGQLQKAIEWLEKCVALDEAIEYPYLENDRLLLNSLRLSLARQKPSTTSQDKSPGRWKFLGKRKQP